MNLILDLIARIIVDGNKTDLIDFNELVKCQFAVKSLLIYD